MNENPQTILIIDDNPELLHLISETLVMLGNYIVFTAQTGIEGLERLADVHPVCVIVDVRMPELDGIQFVRAVRGDPATANIPLVMLTAMAQDHQQFTGLASGADVYLIKPVKPQALLAAIQRALEVESATRDEEARRLAEQDEKIP